MASAQETTTPATTPATAPASVNFVSTTPTLTQQSAKVWTTTVVLETAGTCPGRLSYQLVTQSPSGVVAGRAGAPELIPPAPAATSGGCGALSGQDAQVAVTFTLDKGVPGAATLVVDQPGSALAPAGIALTVHRLVNGWQYLWAPLICGLVMAAVLALLIAALAGAESRHEMQPGDTLRQRLALVATRPVYASAAWTFQDSWATNIATVGTAVVTVLAATGAVSTLLPGVQMDRYAVLTALCGAIIVAAPIVFGIVYGIVLGSVRSVADNATVTFPGDDACLHAPGGATVTLPAGATLQDAHSSVDRRLKPGATIVVPPGSLVQAHGGTAVFPGDDSVVLTGACTVRISRRFTVSPDQIQPPPAQEAPEGSVCAGPDATLVMAAGTDDGITVKVVGFVSVDLPRGSTARAPGGKVTAFPWYTTLRVPLGSNVIVADVRSLIPAAVTTMFGIGAELGIIGVLAGTLSAAGAAARAVAVAAVAAMGVGLLVYAFLTTRVLLSTSPGSALSTDRGTSFTL